MKIVYATRAAVPHVSAESIHTMQLCECLGGMGHEVTLAVGAKFWRRSPSQQSIWQYYGVDENFTIRRFLEFPRTGLLFDRAIVGHVVKTGALLYARYVRIVPKAIRLSVPTILEIHTMPSPADLATLAAIWESDSLLGVVVLTEGLKSDLLKTVQPQSGSRKLIVAPDAVSPRRFVPSQFGESESVAAGYVGSLFPGKGLEVILPVAERCRSTTFHVFGGRGTILSSLMRQSAATKNLHWHGFLPPAEVRNRFSMFQIALLPNQPVVTISTGDDIGRYTSPMKLFEYMAAGKAILASDLPVLREILQDGVNALLVPHDDAAAWASAIKKLSADSKLRESLGRRARQDAVEKYSYETRFESILQAFVGDAKFSTNRRAG